MKRLFPFVLVAAALFASAMQALEIRMVLPTPDQDAVYGQVRRVIITNPGAGYVSGATATLVGPGVQAEVTPVLSNGAITGVLIGTPGASYRFETPPQIVFRNPDGSAAPSVQAEGIVELAQAFRMAAAVTGPVPEFVSNVRFFVNGKAVADAAVSPNDSTLWAADFRTDRPGVYTMHARVTDGFGNVAFSPPVQYRVGGITLLEPNTSQLTTGGSTIFLGAEALAASTVDGQTVVNLDRGILRHVVFEWANSPTAPDEQWVTVLTDPVPPYGSFATLPQVSSATYRYYRARYQTTTGDERSSPVQQLTILPPATPPPSATLIEPLDGTRIQNGTVPIRVGTSITAGGAPIRHVRFFANDSEITPLAQVLPYQILWTPSTAGSYTVRALVTDQLDNTVQTGAAVVTVSGGGTSEPAPGVIVSGFTARYEAKFSPPAASPGVPTFVGGPDVQVLSLALSSESRGVAAGSVVNDVWLVPEGRDSTAVGTSLAYRLGSIPFSGIPSGSSDAPSPFSIFGSFTIPTGLSGQLPLSVTSTTPIPPGKYRIMIRFSTVLNRTDTIGDVEVTALPDLQFNLAEDPSLATPNSGLRFRPGSYRAGDFLPDLSVSLVNRGTWKTTKDWTIDIRLSTDAVVGNADDFLLARVVGPELFVDDYVAGSGIGKAVVRFNGGTGAYERPKVRLPGNLAGSYFVFATINSTSTQAEIDTTNNTTSDTITSNIIIEPSVFPLVTRVSQLADELDANGVSEVPSISADGRHVAFLSAARNLSSVTGSLGSQVYVRNRDQNSVAAISLPVGGGSATGRAYRPSLSGDGRFVVFASEANNLVAGDTNGLADIFLHDRDVSGSGEFDLPGNRSLVRVSVSSAGTQANGASFRASISADGRWVAFESLASNLTSGTTGSLSRIYVWDRLSRRVTLVSTTEAGLPANGASSAPVISANGRHVAFESVANNLVAGDTNGLSDVFVVDRDAGNTGFMDTAGGTTVRRASVGFDPATGFEIQLNGASSQPSISHDGRLVAFASLATNVDLSFARGSIRLLQNPADGATLTLSDGSLSAIFEFDSDGIVAPGRVPVTRAPALRDSHAALFAAIAARISAGDLALYVADATDQYGYRLGLANARVGTAGNQLITTSQPSAISVIGFAGGGSGANAVANVYVHDRDAVSSGEYDRTASGARSTLPISVPDVRRDLEGSVDFADVLPVVNSTGGSGTNPLSLGSLEPSLSGDGRYVAFRTLAYNLGTSNTVANTSSVFVHDRLSLTNQNLSINRFGEEAGQNVASPSPTYTSQDPSISADGRFVAYSSDAGNLVYGASNLFPVDQNNLRDVFLADQRISTSLPEVGIVSIAYDSGVYQPGSSLPLEITLRNRGAADVVAGQEIPIWVWLTKNPWPSAAGDLVLSKGTLKVAGGLAAGATRTLSGTVGIPTGGLPDRYYLAALAGRPDDDRDVFSAQSSYSTALFVSANRNLSTNTQPDFAFDSSGGVSVTAGRYARGHAVPVTVSIFNGGVVSGQDVAISFIFTPDGNPASVGAIVSPTVATVSGLSETSRSVQADVILPDAAVPGTKYFVLARINLSAAGTAIIPESTTSNNSALTPSASVEAATNPDLGFGSPAITFDSNQSYVPGQEVPVTVAISNLNSFRPSRDYVVTLVLLEPSGAEIPSSAINRVVTNFSAASVTLEFRLALTAALAEGSYGVRARIDGDNQVVEVSKANNTADSPQSLRITRSAPVVSLVQPAAGGSLPVNSTILVAAFATSDRGVASVEFLVNGARLGVDQSPPYTFQWRPSSTGSQVLTARATDVDGLTGVSSSLTFEIVPAASQAPTVTLQAPSSAELFAGNPVTLTAVASDPDSAVASVEFLAGTRSLGVRTSLPFTTSWTPDIAGTYELRAIATDATGSRSVSPSVLVTVAGPVTPSVSLSLVGSSNVAAGGSVSMTALLQPGILSASTMDLYLSGVKVATQSGPGVAFNFAVTPQVAGTYELVAVATETNGRVTRSPVIPLYVGRTGSRLAGLSGTYFGVSSNGEVLGMLAGERLDLVLMPASTSTRPSAIVGAQANLSGDFDVPAGFGSVGIGGGSGQFRTPSANFVLSPRSGSGALSDLAGAYTGQSGSRTALLLVSQDGFCVVFASGTASDAATFTVAGTGAFSRTSTRGTAFSGTLSGNATATLTVGSGTGATTFNLTRVAPNSAPAAGALYLQQIERR